MRRVQLSLAAVAAALVPAAVGLWGNASFSADVPVRVPDQVSSHGPTAAPSTGSRVGADHGGDTSGHGGRHGTDDPAGDDSAARGGRGTSTSARARGRASPPGWPWAATVASDPPPPR